jgi:hypothetical protein
MAPVPAMHDALDTAFMSKVNPGSTTCARVEEW